MRAAVYARTSTDLSADSPEVVSARRPTLAERIVAADPRTPEALAALEAELHAEGLLRPEERLRSCAWTDAPPAPHRVAPAARRDGRAA